MSRSAEEVLNDHLDLANRGEIEQDLQRNFADDFVALTTYGEFRGHDGARRAAQLLDEQLGRTRYEYHTLKCHGEVGFLEWTAEGPKGDVLDGADSYLIRDGKIRVMTIHYTVQPKTAAEGPW
jgi:hypothetical protein